MQHVVVKASLFCSHYDIFLSRYLPGSAPNVLTLDSSRLRQRGATWACQHGLNVPNVTQSIAQAVMISTTRIKPVMQIAKRKQPSRTPSIVLTKQCLKLANASALIAIRSFRKVTDAIRLLASVSNAHAIYAEKRWRITRTSAITRSPKAPTVALVERHADFGQALRPWSR